MNLTISGHHLEVTPALRGYVIQKLDRVMRHFDKVVDVRVLLSVEKQKEKEGRQRAECNIHVKGSDLFAESASQDLYAAVDDLVDQLLYRLFETPSQCFETHVVGGGSVTLGLLDRCTQRVDGEWLRHALSSLFTKTIYWHVALGNPAGRRPGRLKAT